ncbi:MAG TPA: acyl-CoA thioesterase domain-containing protein, partial [Acidimicrobiia bacterium]|nr:acyl-CoA thioesterase domain-containing protein [Acidimicrobiia bacterium]
MGDLAADTQVAGDAGRYTARLSRAWEIWGPNGGYLAAIALRAAGAHSRFDHPASIVGHFLGVARFDEVQLDVTTLRAAKRAESMRVSMTQQGEPVFEALVWTTGDVNGLEHDRTTFPATFEPESVPSSAERIAAA